MGVTETTGGEVDLVGGYTEVTEDEVYLRAWAGCVWGGRGGGVDCVSFEEKEKGVQ
jgi:hypothetical protein